MHRYEFDNIDMYALVVDDTEELNLRERLEDLYTSRGVDYQTNTKRKNPSMGLNRRSVHAICREVWERWNAVKESSDDHLFQPLGVLISRDRVIIVHNTPGFPAFHPPASQPKH